MMMMPASAQSARLRLSWPQPVPEGGRGALRSAIYQVTNVREMSVVFRVIQPVTDQECRRRREPGPAQRRQRFGQQLLVEQRADRKRSRLARGQQLVQARHAPARLAGVLNQT